MADPYAGIATVAPDRPEGGDPYASFSSVVAKEPKPNAAPEPIKLYSANPDAPTSYGGGYTDKPVKADAALPKPPEPKSQGVGLNLTAGGYEALSHLLGTPADMGAALIAPKIWDRLPDDKKEQLRKENPNQSAFMDFVSNASKHPSLGSEWWKHALESAGAKIDAVQPTTPGEHAARAAGGAAVDMAGFGLAAESMISRGMREAEMVMKSLDGVLPSTTGAPTTIGHMVRGQGMTSNALMGAAAGAGGEVAAENVPDQLKPTARLVGGLAAGAPVAAGSTFFDRMMGAARETFGRAFEAPQLTAARRIEDAAQNPGQMRAEVSNVANAEPLVAGSEPTTFQASGDLGIGALERKVARGDAAPDFIQRGQDQNAARMKAIEALKAGDANPEDVATFVRTQLRALEQEHAENVSTAAKGVAENLAKAGGERFDNPAAYGEALREPLADLHDKAKQAASRLWRAIDPDLTAPVNTGPLKQASAELVETIPQAAKAPGGEESSILKTIEEMGDSSHFGNMVALRSRLTDAMREERRSGTPTVLRRLTILLGHVDDTLANTAGEIAADTQRAPGVTARLQNEVDAWYARRANERTALTAGGGAGPGDEANVTGGPRGIPPTSRAEVQAGGEPGVPAGDQGVQNAIWKSADHDIPVQIKPGTGASRGSDGRMYQEVIFEGRPSFVPADELVASSSGRNAEIIAASTPEEIAARYAAAREATKDVKQTYESGAVGSVLAPGGQYGSFKTTASNVAKRLIDRPEDLQAFVEAAKDNPEALSAMRDFAAFSMRQTSMRDGLISPNRLQKWVDDHGYVFEHFPDLKAKFSSVKTAQTALDEVLARQKQSLADFQDGAVRHFLGGDDPVKAVGRAIGNRDEFGKLVDVLKKEPATEVRDAQGNVVGTKQAAIDGLKRAAVDWLMATGRGTGTAEAGTSGVSQINGATLQRAFINNRPALAKLFSPEELASMQRVIADIRQANRSVSGSRVPGGSDTAQNQSGGTMTALRAVLSRFGESAAGAVAGASVGAHSGVGAELGAILGTAGGAFLTGARANRANAVDRAVADMLLNPKVADAWLSKLPQGALDTWQTHLARRLRALAAGEIDGAIDREGK